MLHGLDLSLPFLPRLWYVSLPANGTVQGAPADEASAWQKQERAREVEDREACSVKLQPINDFKTQRIKNKLSHCLNKAVRK